MVWFGRHSCGFQFVCLCQVMAQTDDWIQINKDDQGRISLGWVSSLNLVYFQCCHKNGQGMLYIVVLQYETLPRNRIGTKKHMD